jgi:predicted transporter
MLNNWHSAISGTLLGILASLVFFAISVISTYHIDLGVAELLFPYSAIVDPYSIFGGIAFIIAAIQWPLYGFVGGIARDKRRDSSSKQLARAIISAIIIVHLIAAGVAYYHRSRRSLVLGRNLTTHSTGAEIGCFSFDNLKARYNTSRPVNSSVMPLLYFGR